MTRMPDIGREAWDAIFGHQPRPPAAPVTSNVHVIPDITYSTQEEPMAFAATVRNDAAQAAHVLARLAPWVEAIAANPAVDELLEVALAAVHVPAPVISAAASMLRAEEAKHAAAAVQLPQEPPVQQPQTVPLA